MTDVIVRLDDSVRLVSAVLAATNFPATAHGQKPHGTHAHARSTERYLKAYREHEAVSGMQSLLDSGAPLEAMYTLVAHLPWPSLQIREIPKWVPPNWPTHLADFYEQSNLQGWWNQEKHLWDAAYEQSEMMFKGVRFKPFLAQFVGEIQEDLIFIPNISYPSDREIAMRISNKELVAICPPRLAWGDSPPWPFDEDKPYIHRVALAQYIRLILIPYLRANADVVSEAAKGELPVSDEFRSRYPTWGEQFITIFTAAATAIYLEQLDEREARGYVKEQVKIHKMKILPGAISVFKRYLQERESGKFQSLNDFMPVFPKQLKVARRIMSL